MKLLSGLSLVALLRALSAQIVSHPTAVPCIPRARFLTVADLADLDECFARSQQRPVVLFLHDPGCPISDAAYRQVSGLDAEVRLVDVRTGRSITRAVEDRTGVRHESPQVLVLKSGQALWSASHYAITSRAVEAAILGT